MLCKFVLIINLLVIFFYLLETLFCDPFLLDSVSILYFMGLNQCDLYLCAPTTTYHIVFLLCAICCRHRSPREKAGVARFEPY